MTLETNVLGTNFIKPFKELKSLVEEIMITTEIKEKEKLAENILTTYMKIIHHMMWSMTTQHHEVQKGLLYSEIYFHEAIKVMKKRLAEKTDIQDLITDEYVLEDKKISRCRDLLQYRYNEMDRQNRFAFMKQAEKSYEFIMRHFLFTPGESYEAETLLTKAFSDIMLCVQGAHGNKIL